MVKKNQYILFNLFLFFLSFPLSLFAWSNYFRIVNHSDEALQFSIVPNIGGAHLQPTGILPTKVLVNGHSQSNEIQLTDGKEHWWSVIPKEKGVIYLYNAEGQHNCSIDYYYQYSFHTTYQGFHSLVFSNLTCNNSPLKVNNIDLITPDIKSNARPILKSISILNIDKDIVGNSTGSYAQFDCTDNSIPGPDNCLIVSPNQNNQTPDNTGSTLQQSLNLQINIDRFEPLNFEQFIGTHNSMISPVYTTSKNAFDLSYSDPDNYISLTSQLNAGVRQLEFDILWNNNQILFCHNHVTPVINNILCTGNSSLSSVMAEINQWIAAHPDQLIMIYLDINQNLGTHVADLDKIFSIISQNIFTPKMAQQYYVSQGHALPAYKISANDIIQKYGKHILVVSDEDIADLNNSEYVFTSASHSNVSMLHETGVDDYYKNNIQCNNNDKLDYTAFNQFYGDQGHYNIWRVNGDRTVIAYLSSSNGAISYSDYITAAFIKNTLACPVNIYSLNMLGYTENNTSQAASDPRLSAFLWSWAFGFPLQTGGSDIAYIDPHTEHFANDETVKAQYALCYQPSEAISGPTIPGNWQVFPINNTNVDLTTFEKANNACAPGYYFATPTTSYQMANAMHVIKGINQAVLVNYKKVNNTWQANNGLALNNLN